MSARRSFGRIALGTGCGLLFAGLAWLAGSPPRGTAAPLRGHGHACPSEVGPCADCPEEWAGTWYWLRSPEQEKRVVAALYNRYCVRCHAVDGRGVWDIPDVPNFASAHWQASRSDGQLARAILEGRGAVMPAFRGTLTLEEAWALGRYLRSFVPGSEVSRPESDTPQRRPEELPAPESARPTGEGN